MNNAVANKEKQLMEFQPFSNLINDLDNGLYNIQKQYNNGSIEEQTILKGNN